MLCDTCVRTLLGQQPKLNDWSSPTSIEMNYLHHRRMGDVKAAAERTKCFVCWSIWNSLADDEQSRLMQSQDSVSGDPAQAQSTESANNFGQQSYRSSYQLSMDASSSCSRATDARIIRSVSEAHWHMEVRIRTDFLIGEAPGPIKDSYFIIEPCHNVPVKIHAPQGTNTACPDSLQLARHWIDTCDARHDGCNKVPARNGWNPTRLIEVGNVASGTVKVITTISIDHELAYFTLSHRWVDSDALKLTRHTHLDFSRGIAVAELPKKFQDAIHVARLFGRRYLWIDSLCILQDQDDKSDWIRESTQMDKVYMHGDCNLSAIGAVDGPGGLFQNRRPDMLFSQAAFVPPDQDGSGTYQIMIARDEEWVSEVHSAGLNQRGWVVQERVLSKRVLYFGPEQLLWECCELDACEVYPQGVIHSMPEDMACVGFKAKTAVHHHTAATSVDDDVASTIYKLWDHVIDMYSACSLTIPGDKLIAVSGIANRLKAVLNDEYVAGLWRLHLDDGLFWSGTGLRRSRSQTWVAPTWSWASVDREISPGNFVGKDAMFEASPFFEILSITWPEQGHRPSTTEHQVMKLTIKGHLQQLCRLVPQGLPSHDDLDFSSTNWWPAFEWDALDTSLLDNYRNGSLFFMAGRKCHFFEDSDEFYVLSLLLRCEDAAAGLFTRVGIHRNHPTQQNVELIMGRDEDEQLLPCLEWDAETGFHTICII